MSTPWNSLFCPSEDRDVIVRSLQESLTVFGYEPYNPFGAFPGKSYKQTVKLFVAPSHDGWTRVIGAPDEGQMVELSRMLTCLYIQLDAANAHIAAYQDAQQVEPFTAMTPYLIGQSSADQLRDTSSAAYDDIRISPASTGLPFDAMPDDVRALAGGIDKGAAEKMFNRLSGQLLKKVGGQADEVHGLMNGEGAPDWEGRGGHRIRAFMNLLTVPDNWREPDFDTLRDAYALHERRRRLPNARLYPGDETVMARVPNALAYTPVYGGRN